jgi:hypothetical protein
MATTALRDLIVASVLLTALAACNTNPTPRSAAQQGVVPSADRGALNAPYYTGADPAYQRGRGGGGGGP